jgi:hypothetical protein
LTGGNGRVLQAVRKTADAKSENLNPNADLFLKLFAKGKRMAIASKIKTTIKNKSGIKIAVGNDMEGK